MALSAPAQIPPASSSAMQILEKASDGQPLFKGPVSVRCHPDGRLWVVDDLAHRVLVFDRTGRLERTLSEHGSKPGQLMWPDAIHWDDRGDLYLADTGANRIQVWDGNGAYLRAFGRPPRWREALQPALALVAVALAVAALAVFARATSPQAGRPLLGTTLIVASALAAGGWALCTFVLFNGLRNPRDVLVGPDGLVYVSDFGGDSVRVFTRGGALIRSIGRPGNGTGELRKPLGLAISGDGKLLVADAGNHRVQVFALDGTFIRTLGRRGSKPGELESPHGLEIGPDGLLYVADRGNRRVQVWTTEGRALRMVTPEPERSAAFAPAGLCLADDGRLVVVDLETHRVVIQTRDW